MTRRALTSVFTAAALALAVPVIAEGQSGARPNSTGGSSGSAVSRPSGGSGGGGSSSSGGSSMSSPSGGGSSVAPAGARPSGGEYRAPSAPERRTGTAVPRGSAVSGSDTRRVSPGTAASAPDTGERRRAVPAYSRPRDGRPVTGVAVPRTSRPLDPRHRDIYWIYYDPFFRYSYYYSHYPYGYFWPGYGFGVGYFYDPWMWGYYGPASYGGYYGSTYGRSDYREVGGIRLKVAPKHAQVYVDGYYVGEVDSFDGVFQKLNLEGGAHRIEIRAEGFIAEEFEVMVIPGQTITYKGELKRQD